jgi:hypothetical protein
VALHPSRRIAEPVIGRAFARPVGDAPESLTEKTVNEMKTRGFSVVIARAMYPDLPLRGAKRRSNPFFGVQKLDCFASLAMTA